MSEYPRGIMDDAYWAENERLQALAESDPDAWAEITLANMQASNAADSEACRGMGVGTGNNHPGEI